MNEILYFARAHSRGTVAWEMDGMEQREVHFGLGGTSIMSGGLDAAVNLARKRNEPPEPKALRLVELYSTARGLRRASSLKIPRDILPVAVKSWISIVFVAFPNRRR
jgi:hypothetical protein